MLVNYTPLFIVLFCAFRKATSEAANFRILAPEIVCPKDENAVIEKPDNTVITLQTEEDLEFTWTVRWVLLDAPSQRFTVLLWRTVRALEAQLNGPQPEPLAYVINNTQLLAGVDYIFNVTSVSSEDSNGTMRSFHIDNVKGDRKLIVAGRSDKFSVFLVGGINVFTDMKYILVAEVTTCSPVQDYYFTWNVEASGNIINVSDISGWRLQIPPYSLRAGESYCVTCRVYRNNSLVTQTELPFQVLFRELNVYLNVDVLFVTIDNVFSVEATVENPDYYEKSPKFEWNCTFHDEPCENFESTDTSILLIPLGFAKTGQYELTVKVNVLDQQGSAAARITVVEPTLPVIQVQPFPRLLTKGRNILLIANASNVAPSCTLTWYFATEEQLASLGKEHGNALSDSLTIFSLEENFLNEIADFTNETEWRQVTAEVEVVNGRARFVAECGCSLTFSCETKGMVYADISFRVNQGPTIADIKISPELGTAMETVFRISKLSASDPNQPLLYKLFCSLGNSEPLLLGFNLEHLAVDTFLPYIDIYTKPSSTKLSKMLDGLMKLRRSREVDGWKRLSAICGVDLGRPMFSSGRVTFAFVQVDEGGTEIWAEVCDSLGACSTSNMTIIHISTGGARSKEVLVEAMRGFVLRCEVMLLNQVVRSTVVTYSNANQAEALAGFTKDLIETLPAEEDCLRQDQEYLSMLHWLADRGIDTSGLE